MNGVRSALWILVVGEVFASFAHPFFYLGHIGYNHAGLTAPAWLILPGGGFSLVGGIVFLYFAAALERATEALAQESGRTGSQIVLGVLCCFPGLRVVGELLMLLRVRRYVAAAVEDAGLAKRVGAIAAVRAVVQVVGLVPAYFGAAVIGAGAATPWTWLFVSVCPLLSLVLLLVGARMLTGALADHFGTAKPLAGLASAEPVAMSMRGEP